MDSIKPLFKVSLGKLERVYPANDENEARCLFSAEIVCDTINTVNKLCEVRPLDGDSLRWERFKLTLQRLPKEMQVEAMMEYVRNNNPIGSSHNEIYKKVEADTTRFFPRLPSDNKSW